MPAPTTLAAEPGQADPLHQLCTFSVDTLHFGVDVLTVQEVIRHQEMTPVPLAPGAVSGLINLRGQIVTAIDLRQRLGLPGRGPEDPAPLNVVVRTPEGVISLLVDQIGDVLEVDAEELEAPPPTLQPAARGLIEGVYKLDGRLLLRLDTAAATDV